MINPIIDSLGREVSLLDIGNLTWRSYLGRCEFIKPIQEYVDAGQWPNYSDFLADNPLFSKTFGKHDDDLRTLNAKAKDTYDWLLSSDRFPQTVQGLLDTYEQRRASMGPEFPSFNNSRPDLPKVFAEHLINNVQNLPSHYMFWPLWNFAGKQLLEFRSLPAFQSLHSARADLVEISSSIKGGLEDHRLDLSRKFDVPAAPVPGLSFEE